MTTNAATVRLTLHQSALAGMQTSRPKNLLRALAFHAEGEGAAAEACATGADFQDTLYLSHSTDQLVELWRKQLTQWDYAEGPAWSSSEPHTADRRADVLDLLGLPDETRKLLNTLIPVAKASEPVVISARHPNPDWYTPQSLRGRSWYWPAYRRLLSEKGWSETAVAGLDTASDRVVERLADPTSASAYQSKGLVVGYVQSGKTANFTGVIAKAVDAGYRLVIVLGGTLNLLRAQTQRRLDMELVGRENILRGAAEYESDYADDPAWSRGKFLSHGGQPSALGGFDIHRMTTRDDDYKSLLQGIVALEFEKQEPALPLHDARNLHRSAARLMVVKKNKSVLAKLVKDLNKIKTALGEIPVLIIDDESDEASVNTANPNKPDVERTAINDKISELLQMLPRAQYVGYTATPFANVFVDPSDSEDIFPKDFIVSLPRPSGYMGVQDFHDLDTTVEPAERTVANSNEKAHVRNILLSDPVDDSCLQQAMDMFVLTAAMKLYRESNGLGDRHFQHHTMLIHESVRTAEHRELLGRVTRLWWNSGYTGASGHARLRSLFETDVAPVSRVRADGHAMPASYDELAPYIGAAAIRIGGDDQPIIVVNGDKDIETGEADFDKRSIWKILIGGQKLARGFTIEGLTVTYYRRRTNNASTLMQMGRWFGFRNGYRDLVRLYLGREETMGAKEIDLYEAFEAICRDEETFREQLRQYSEPVDGHPQVTPAQVPPLVSQHLSWLRPTSANKMFNSELIEIRSPGKPIEPAAYPVNPAAIKRNTERWRPLLDSLSPEPRIFASEAPEADSSRIEALTGLVSHSDLVRVLSQLEWERPGHFAPHLTYLSQLDGTLAKVDDWLFVAPQLTSGQPVTATVLGSAPLSLVRRARQPGKVSFGRIAGMEHRNTAELLVSGSASAASRLGSPRRGIALFYPVVEAGDTAAVRAAVSNGVADPSRVIMAFTLLPPAAATGSSRQLVRFRTKDSARLDAPIVTTDSL
ncbi:Z1 domain protein [Streptomyces sp. YIM 130001]|uniref:Z1 domain-containing protein n=1 Tax=Streptomyces sp. YIM 130001 TaxID=2259644 RepID=UPI000ECE8B30|nr:Z1 domain-containing protein [Streptomyces sp. YIM 130001]RII19716.1 Z1 domain protein [Streptomyces sp. YIM 130001]